MSTTLCNVLIEQETLIEFAKIGRLHKFITITGLNIEPLLK